MAIQLNTPMLKEDSFSEISTLSELAQTLEKGEVVQGERTISLLKYGDPIPYKEVLARVVDVMRKSITLTKTRDLQDQIRLYQSAQAVGRKIEEFSQKMDRSTEEVCSNVLKTMCWSDCCRSQGCYTNSEVCQEEMISYWVKKHYTDYFEKKGKGCFSFLWRF